MNCNKCGTPMTQLDPREITDPQPSRFVPRWRCDEKECPAQGEVVEEGKEDGETAMNGADLIKQERIRQIAVEGWSPEHDEKWTHGEMWLAASCYIGLDDFEEAPELWPWSRRWWKPKSRISNLIRAGALIAAEIDRLQRLQAALRGGLPVCPYCGDNRAGKGSFIWEGRTFCDEDHFEEWHTALREKQNEDYS